MPGIIDPAGVHSDRKNILDRLKEKVLDGYDFSIATCGHQSEVRDFDSETGYWQEQSDVRSKPPRWLFHLEERPEGLHASVPSDPASDQIGYYNVSNRDNVAVITSRILPVIRIDDEYHLYEKWEWVCVVFFSGPLDGSSAEIVKGFRPPGFQLHGGRTSPETLALQVFTLCPGNLECSLPQFDRTYSEATQALAQLLKIPVESV